MIVIAAAATFAVDPLAGRLVLILADVRLAVGVLAVDVGEKRVEIIARSDGGIFVVAYHIREGAERLRSSKRPDGAVPLASAITVRAELRMATLGGCDAVGSAKTLRVGKLSPCDVVFPVVGWQFEIPRDE